jgi:hypothetical protein
MSTVLDWTDGILARDIQLQIYDTHHSHHKTPFEIILTLTPPTEASKLTFDLLHKVRRVHLHCFFPQPNTSNSCALSRSSSASPKPAPRTTSPPLPNQSKSRSSPLRKTPSLLRPRRLPNQPILPPKQHPLKWLEKVTLQKSCSRRGGNMQRRRGSWRK